MQCNFQNVKFIDIIHKLSQIFLIIYSPIISSIFSDYEHTFDKKYTWKSYIHWTKDELYIVRFI